MSESLDKIDADGEIALERDKKGGVFSSGILGSFLESLKGSKENKDSMVTTSGRPVDISYSSVGNFSINSKKETKSNKT